MQLLQSRINIASLASIVTSILLMLSGMGLIGAALTGLIVHLITTAVVIKDKFGMTNDPYILAVAIIGGVISSIELITATQVFPAVNPLVWNISLGVLTIILRELSQPKTA